MSDGGMLPPPSELRPWSDLEAEEQADQVLDALASAVFELDTYAGRAAETEHAYRLDAARAYAALPEGRSNKEARDHAVYEVLEAQADADERPHRRFARDLAAEALKNQRVRISQLQTEAGIAQSKMVGARKAQP